MPGNEFLPFAHDPAANVMPWADYQNPAFVARTMGFTTGTALSVQLNTVWHQASLMTAMLGNFVVTETGLDMLDDGTAAGMAALQTNYRAAVAQVALATIGTGYVKLTGDVMTGPLGTTGIAVNAPAGSNAGIELDRNPGAYALIQANTNDVARWHVQVANNEPETGSNIGSNFTIARFDDAGVFLGAPLSIDRASGRVNFTTSPTVNGDLLPYLPLAGGNLYGRMGAGGTGIAYQGVGWQNYMALGWNGAHVMASVDGTYVGELATVAEVQALASGAYLPLAGGQVTGNLGVSGVFVADGGAGFRSSVWFANYGDFINFSDGRYRVRQWAADWFDVWDNASGFRGWSAGPGAGWGMSLDGLGNLRTKGVMVADGTRILSQGAGATVAVHWPGNGAGGLWWDRGLWLGWTDGAGNPTSGKMWMGTDDWLRVYGGIASSTAGIYTEGPVNALGTISGATLISQGNIHISGLNDFVVGANGFDRGLLFQSGVAGLFFNTSDLSLRYVSNTTQEFFRWENTGAFWSWHATAGKAGGGPWVAASDARLKHVEGDYTTGLAAIRALQPRRYRYRPGQLQHEGTPYPTRAFVGLVAQDVEGVMPEMVSRRAGLIDGAAVTDMRVLDANALTYAMLNAIKELAAEVDALKAGR